MKRHVSRMRPLAFDLVQSEEIMICPNKPANRNLGQDAKEANSKLSRHKSRTCHAGSEQQFRRFPENRAKTGSSCHSTENYRRSNNRRDVSAHRVQC